MVRYDVLEDGPGDARMAYVFAHGAGGPMKTPFMNAIARGLGANGVRVVRFEFPYMAARRKRPDPQNALLESWRDVIRQLGDPKRLVIGGKSMGGRIASMVADEMDVAGLLCYGYPFHPPGQPDRLRTAHLTTLTTRALFVLGTRDPFGRPEEVEAYDLSQSIRLAWIPGGDHSFKPPAGAGVSERENLQSAVEHGAAFIGSF